MRISLHRKKFAIKLRAMDRYVAAGALAAGLKAQAAVRERGLSVEAGVTLQAELPAFPPHQHQAIGAAVGIVADHAAFHPHGRVLINVGPAFFHVALDAGLPVGGIQAGAIDAAVRVMTVRTLHQALRHPVVHRQGELRLDVAMAGKAQIRLGLLQQAAVQPAHRFGKLRHLEESCLRVRQGCPCFDL